MRVEKFVDSLDKLGVSYYTGVPDSLLAPLNSVKPGVVAANEGAAVGLAIGHYLSTGKPACVYMQNSGIGNTVNPVCSLLHDDVYGIPVVFVVGWRGQPGTKDEPQHVFQGKCSKKLLEDMDIAVEIISKQTENLDEIINNFDKHIKKGKSVAFLVEKGALENDNIAKFANDGNLTREKAVGIILENTLENDIFVSTTGKLSREVFEARETRKEGHGADFLTVGGMGHSLMIAAGIAEQKPDRRVFCLDGDGAAVMHMGSLSVVNTLNLKNLTHILINNGSHESVGGMPVCKAKLKFRDIAKSLGYDKVFSVCDETELKEALAQIDGNGTVFIEVFTNLESRDDLGRPTTTPKQNRDAFMKFVRGD